MAYVPVPKDLTKVKTKVALNLTKRQLIFFSLAAVVGIPFYLFMRKPIGSSIAAILMVTIMLPFFFMAMYEKDGLPFEKVVANIIRQKFICPAVRPYKTENFYQEISTLVKRRVCRMAKKTKQEAQQERLSLAEKKKPSGKKKQKSRKEREQEKRRKKQERDRRKQKNIPTTAQQSIPYIRMLQDGICQVTKTFFLRQFSFMTSIISWL